MKIKFISLIIIFSLVQGLFNQGLAQEGSGQGSSSSASKIGYGIRFGGNRLMLTDHNGTTFSEADYGYSAGAFVSYQVNDMISILGKVAYNVQNFKNITESTIFNTDGPMFSADYIDDTKTHLNLQNVEGVVKVNIYPFSMGDIKPKLFVGYSANFIFKAEANTERTSTIEENNVVMQSQTTSVHHDVTDRFAYLNHAVVLGVGADLDIEVAFIKGFSLDLDYKYGVNNINNVTHYQELSTNTLELVLGAKF